MPLAHFFNTKKIQFIFEARLSLTRMPRAETPTHSPINTSYILSLHFVCRSIAVEAHCFLETNKKRTTLLGINKRD